MMTQIGYDLDGVICSTNIRDVVKNKMKLRLMEYFSEQFPLLTDEFFNDEAIVITARDEEMKDMTEWWLKFYYPKTTFKLYCVGYDKDTKKRKVEVMKKENITIFLDDNKRWINYIKKSGINGIHID